jgi:hypothetical protein
MGGSALKKAAKAAFFSHCLVTSATVLLVSCGSMTALFAQAMDGGELRHCDR